MIIQGIDSRSEEHLSSKEGGSEEIVQGLDPCFLDGRIFDFVRSRHCRRKFRRGFFTENLILRVCVCLFFIHGVGVRDLKAKIREEASEEDGLEKKIMVRRKSWPVYRSTRLQ